MRASRKSMQRARLLDVRPRFVRGVEAPARFFVAHVDSYSVQLAPRTMFIHGGVPQLSDRAADVDRVTNNEGVSTWRVSIQTTS
jgi:hypothetical protein